MSPLRFSLIVQKIASGGLLRLRAMMFDCRHRSPRMTLARPTVAIEDHRVENSACLTYVLDLLVQAT
jgi:hypothetical protein